MSLFSGLFGKKKKAEASDEENFQSLHKVTLPLPDYTTGTCEADLQHIQKTLGLEYESCPIEHLTVIWEWVKKESPYNIGYDSEVFKQKIQDYKSGKLAIIEKSDQLYLVQQK